jgi:hypothetical protein
VEERTLDIPAFSAISVDGAMHVTVEKGDVQKVTVTAQRDLFALLDTTVHGDVWEISTSKCWTSSSDINVRITTPTPLSSIEVTGSAEVNTTNVFGTDDTGLSVSGSGSIAVADINAKHLDLDIAGSGTITVRGTCANLEGNISGSGGLQAVDLAANAVRLSISGSGDAMVKAITSLDAEVSGSGTIRYAGKPQVNSQISGSGSVSPLP